MLGFTVRSLDKLPIHTPFVLNGRDMIKVRHPQYGFAARTGDGETVVLAGKTPVHVAKKPEHVPNALELIQELETIRRAIRR